MIKVPCYKCKVRELGCHSRCAAYREYKRTLNRINETKLKESKMIEHKIDAIFRMSGKGSQI